jgi:transcriptional regulator with XRE-family HTH domain
MVTKHVLIKFKFSHIKFATAIRANMMLLKITNEELSELSGMSEATISGCASNNNPNPHMNTFLAIANALDLNPLDYIELEY